jgi:pilus assembly protein FimV
MGAGMNNRIVSWAAVACLSAYSCSAYAVALGEMRVLSALGEPLKIQLMVNDLGPVAASDTRVILAPSEDYSRLGLIPPVGADQWQVSMQSNGQLSALISGVAPQQEANVNFLVQLIWPGHIRVQQVTAVLLPPASPVEPSPAEPPQLAETSPEKDMSTPGTATLTVDEAESVVVPLVAPAAGAKPFVEAVERIEAEPLTARIQAGDTLSGLAKSWPLPQASLEQKQQILAEGNPRIFVDGNINQLKRGALLRYPLSTEIKLPAPDQAREWLEARRSGTHPSAVATLNQPALSAAPEAKSAGGTEEVTLTLISPKADDSTQAAQAEALIADELAQLDAQKNSLLAERAALQAELAELENAGRDQDARLQVLDAKLAQLNAVKPTTAPETVASKDSSNENSLRPSWVAAAVGFFVALLIILRRRAAAASNAALAARVAPITPVANDYVAFEPLDQLPTPPWTAVHSAAESEPEIAPALAVVSDGLTPEVDAEAESEYDFMSDAEAAALQTRLDLAQAYIDMQEIELAKELLDAVIVRGNAEQQAQARQIFESLS